MERLSELLDLRVLSFPKGMVVTDLLVFARQATGEALAMELNQAQCRALGINAGFIIFIIIIMGMRMWARLVITKAIGLDDSKYIIERDYFIETIILIQRRQS